MEGIETVKCTHIYTVYPSKNTPRLQNGVQWMKANYKREDGTSFSATGYQLPEGKNLSFVLHGQWKHTEKYGTVLEVTSHEVILPNGEQGVIAYLTSLKVRIGQKKAKAIYKKFGDRVWDLLEQDPDQLTAVPGITPHIVSRLRKRLIETRVERDLMQVFEGVISLSHRKISAIKNKLGLSAAEELKHNPYLVCQVSGFTFLDADRLGIKLGFTFGDPKRLQAATGCILTDAAQQGHVCLPKEEYLIRYLNLLHSSAMPGSVTQEMAKDAINKACQDGLLRCTSGMIYSKFRHEQETQIVSCIARLMNHCCQANPEIQNYLKQYEVENSISLSEDQKEAVTNVFSHPVSIITGGPGTGKTTTIKAILYIHQKIYENASDIWCLAPTGRAARRMEEATGYPAYTIHSVAHFTGERDSFDEEDLSPLPGNLFIIDETSMMDMYITSLLLQKIQESARVVFVGDPQQLPSVGCGNVLADLIRCGKIPTKKLRSIFRQTADHPIITNSNRISCGRTDLLLDRSFRVLVEADRSVLFYSACDLYMRCVKAYGIHQVAMLCPYRKKTDLSVDRFNEELQRHLNPPDPAKLSMEKSAHMEFRIGDLVMQTRNTDTAKNGDIGVIKNILLFPDPDDPSSTIKKAVIEFNQDGFLQEYSAEQCQDLDLAYCTTVHKSQGSEYKTVIVVLSSQHTRLLRRNIIYTAITRAKENLAILADHPSVISQAIENDKTDRRYTLLADRLVHALKNTKYGTLPR